MVCFQVLSPVSGLPIIGLTARDPQNLPITALLGEGLGSARRVSGRLVMFGLDADGTYRDMTNAEMDGFVLDQVEKGSLPVPRMARGVLRKAWSFIIRRMTLMGMNIGRFFAAVPSETNPSLV